MSRQRSDESSSRVELVTILGKYRYRGTVIPDLEVSRRGDVAFGCVSH